MSYRSFPQKSVIQKPVTKPLVQYGSSEAVSSAAWFHHSYRCLAAGMGSKWIRIYDVRDGIVRIWDSRRATEPALSFNGDFRNGIGQLAWSPLRSGLLASIGKESTTVKLWDIQEGTTRGFVSTSTTTSGSTAASVTAAAVAVANIPSTSAVPGQTLPIAQAAISTTAGVDGGVGLGPSGAVETGSIASQPNVVGVNVVGAVVGTANTPGNVQTNPGIVTPGVSGPGVVVGAGSNSAAVGADAQEAGIAAGAGGRMVYGAGLEQGSTGESIDFVPVLWKTRQIKPSSHLIQGFAWIPVSPSPSDFSHRIITAHSKDGSLQITPVPDTHKVAWRPLGELAVAEGRALSIYEIDHGAGEKGEGSQIDVDISVVIRRRALMGYSMDPVKNQEIFKQDTRMRDLWAWIADTKHKSSHGKLRISNRDYTFQGVQSVISDMLLANSRTPIPSQSRSSRRSSPTPSTIPTITTSTSSSPKSSSSALPGSAMGSLKPYMGVHRRLALVMCGWGFELEGGSQGGRDALESALKSLQDAGKYEQAAGWALFHGCSFARAIEALNASGDERLKLVATAMAGYLTTSSELIPKTKESETNTNDNNARGSNKKRGISSIWSDLCKSLSLDMKDPFLRAIFALIASDGNWHVVLEETGLSLRDRLGIALRFLDDEALAAYIKDLTEDFVASGNIEGLLLTGLTPNGVSLFEHYVDRTGDVQTAGLVLSAVVPRKFQDTQVQNWVET
ncbi:hypothetical protein HK102_007727 [Quaeritorhiza haematococci]|nr:hypothetical protein HK102_007727 [Quaeritorhiza haematococci]